MPTSEDRPKRRTAGKRVEPRIKAEVRRTYETEVVSTSELSRRFAVKRQTISNWIERESWKSKNEIVADVTSNVIDIATRKAVGEVSERLEQDITQRILAHSEIETLLLDVAKSVLLKAKNGELRAGRVNSEADDIKAAIDAAGKAIDKSREIRGLKNGTPSDSGADDGKRKMRRFIMVTPDEVAAKAAETA